MAIVVAILIVTIMTNECYCHNMDHNDDRDCNDDSDSAAVGTLSINTFSFPMNHRIHLVLAHELHALAELDF